MTPALLARIVALVLPWHEGPIDYDGTTAIVYAGPDRWGDWTSTPHAIGRHHGERAALWHAGAVIVALVVRAAVEVD